MKVARMVLFSVALIVVLLFVAVPTTASADELIWKTTGVHFDRHTLVIRGYFTNQTAEVVDRINSFEARVKLQRHGEWQESASRTFDGFDVFIKPGGAFEYTFRIHDVERRSFDDYRVRWHVSYHWHKHHHDEYHEHHNEW